MTKTINGSNYFQEERLKEMMQALEAGEVISIYIDCIGHTRAEVEEWHYKTALQKKYGDMLIISNNKYGEPTYKLASVTSCGGIKRKRGRRKKVQE